MMVMMVVVVVVVVVMMVVIIRGAPDPDLDPAGLGRFGRYIPGPVWLAPKILDPVGIRVWPGSNWLYSTVLYLNVSMTLNTRGL